MLNASHALAASDPGGAAVNGTTGAILLIGGMVAVLSSVAIFFGRGRRRQVSMQKSLVEDVRIGLDLLALQIEELSPTASAAAADAWDRLSAARRLAAESDAIPVLRAVRHTLLEGLAAAHAARTAAGLNAGPVPPPPSEIPTIDHPEQVTVGGHAWTAQPAYRPGFVHHFPGGKLDGVVVPGGWYAEPFWESLLLTPSDAVR